jgi:cell division transport system permease protein
VFQTVETSIVTRLHEIEIMELVGATRGMVRAPFLIEGALQGVLGGTVAFVLVFVLVRIAATVFPAPVFPAAGVAALNLLLGMVLGLLGAGVALNRIRR